MCVARERASCLAKSRTGLTKVMRNAEMTCSEERNALLQLASLRMRRHCIDSLCSAGPLVRALRLFNTEEKAGGPWRVPYQTLYTLDYKTTKIFGLARETRRRSNFTFFLSTQHCCWVVSSPEPIRSRCSATFDTCASRIDGNALREMIQRRRKLASKLPDKMVRKRHILC